MKQITICDKVYDIDCNALTPMKYKSIFKSGMINDIHSIQNYLIKQVIISGQLDKENISNEEKIIRVSDYMISDVDDFIIKILQITWILIYTADNKVDEFEKWASSIKVKVDDDWIAEVAEFAVDCFC